MELTLGALHNFNTIAPSILGDRFELMRYVSLTYGRDLTPEVKTHLQVQAFNIANVVTGIETNIDEQRVLVFKDQNNIEHRFVESWIDAGTVEQGDKVSLNLTIAPISNNEVELAIAVLQREGFNISSKRTTLL